MKLYHPVITCLFALCIVAGCAPATTRTIAGKTADDPSFLLGRWNGRLPEGPHTIRPGLDALWGASANRVLVVDRVTRTAGGVSLTAWFGIGEEEVTVGALRSAGALQRVVVTVETTPGLMRLTFNTGQIDSYSDVTLRVAGACHLVGAWTLPQGAPSGRERVLSMRKAGCP